MRFVDSNIFIYHMADDPNYGEAATRILKRIEEGEEAATSTLIISQVCGYLRWKRREDAIPAFLDFLRSLPSLRKVETSFDDLLEAKSTLLKLGLSWRMWDDLVVASQMRKLKISEIYSNDKDFDHIPWVKRIF